MSSVKVIKADDRRTMTDFVKFPAKLYNDCHEYVPDLESDISKMFDRTKNPDYAFADAQPFVAYRDGKAVGRIAGIINRRANATWKTRDVRFSMIDFVDDRDVSAALIDAVEQWGREQGMDNILGPLGFTDYDKEGMLLTDFDKMSAMTEYYNYPYYPEHMEALGYEKAVDWVQIRIKVPEEVPKRYARSARLSKELYGLHVRKLRRSDFKHGYTQKFFRLLNESYAPLFRFTPMSESQAEMFVAEYLPLLNLDMVAAVEDEKENLIGLAVTMTSLSHALRRSHGRLMPLGWYYLLRALKWHPEHTAGMLLIAVKPEYQGLGVSAIIFDHLIPVYNRLGIRYAETGPQLEDNVKELSQWKPLNPEYIKRRRCWQKKIKK